MTERTQAGRGAARLKELREALAHAPGERLRWHVLRAFGALPTEGRARRMTDADYLWCALNLLLDGEAAPGPAAGEAEERAGENAAFDEERYERLSRGERA